MKPTYFAQGKCCKLQSALKVLSEFVQRLFFLVKALHICNFCCDFFAEIFFCLDELWIYPHVNINIRRILHLKSQEKFQVLISLPKNILCNLTPDIRLSTNSIKVIIYSVRKVNTFHVKVKLISDKICIGLCQYFNSNANKVGKMKQIFCCYTGCPSSSLN